MNFRLPYHAFGLLIALLLAACSRSPSGSASHEEPAVAAAATVAMTASALPPRPSFVPMETPPSPAPTATSTKIAPIPAPTATSTKIPPTFTPSAPPAPATDFGSAPEIKTDVWLNTEQPVSLASLRGKVVLVDFWTFG